MKLSDAIVLGDSLKKPNNSVWLSPDGSCGCAFGGALLAAGMDVSRAYAENSRPDRYSDQFIRGQWPWLTGVILNNITALYQSVLNGKGTIEQVAEYVRSIEPAENPEYMPDEPECSDSDTARELQESRGKSK